MIITSVSLETNLEMLYTSYEIFIADIYLIKKLVYYVAEISMYNKQHRQPF